MTRHSIHIGCTAHTYFTFAHCIWIWGYHLVRVACTIWQADNQKHVVCEMSEYFPVAAENLNDVSLVEHIHYTEQQHITHRD